MAWTTPRTWVANELVTAALMNTHVRDNLNFVHREINGVTQGGQTVPAAALMGDLGLFSLSGETHELEYRCDAVQLNAGAQVAVALYDFVSGTDVWVTNICFFKNDTGVALWMPATGIFRFTPSVGNHRYRVWLNPIVGTVSFGPNQSAVLRKV